MRRTRDGFTLIELLVVMGIIAVLFVGAASAFVNSRRAARNAERISDMRDYQNAFEQYYGDNQDYPSSGCAELTVAGADYFRANTPPTDPQGVAYSVNCYAAPATTRYCACADVEPGSQDVGNSDVLDCSAFVSAPADYYCVTNLQ